MHWPLVSESACRDNICRRRRGGYWVRWSEVDSFYDSGPTSRSYVVDRLQGSVRFGDGRKGMIPPAGTASVMAIRGRASHHRQAIVNSSPLPVGDAALT